MADALPRSFVMGPHRWQLRTDPLLETVGACHGVTHPRRQLIVLDATLAGTALAEVLMHELLHAALSGASLDEADEERMANAAAGPLLHALRANPPLVKVLLG